LDKIGGLNLVDRGTEAFTIFVIFVQCALEGQGEMAAAHLCLIRNLIYGEIIRKIGFQAFNFARMPGGTTAARLVSS
jgi:hypothetical protein